MSQSLACIPHGTVISPHTLRASQAKLCGMFGTLYGWAVVCVLKKCFASGPLARLNHTWRGKPHAPLQPRSRSLRSDAHYSASAVEVTCDVC
jgi:hypothetical protein